MSKRETLLLIKDIQQATEDIHSFLKGTPREKFIRDIKTQKAVVMSFLIIGEATKELPQELKNRYPDVAWQKMARFRDKLVHHYFVIDQDVVWDVAHNDLPDLKSQIKRILREESHS